MKNVTLVIVVVLVMVVASDLTGFALVGLSGSPRAHAQTGGGYDLTWYTMDNGGGATSNGGYTLNGTLGQPDASTWSGGGYTLAGGFWGGDAAQYRVYLPIVLRQ